MKKIISTLIVATLVSTNVFAQEKGATKLISKETNSCSVKNNDLNVQGNSTTFQSHIKSLGTVGKTGRYSVVSVKVRGLDTPNVAGFLIYDEKTDAIIGMQTTGGNGLGGAIINGSAQAGAAYLFAEHLRPDQYNQNVNSGNSGGGTTINAAGGNSSATGGSATGGSATGGSATGGSASNSNTSNNGQGGGTFVPPGQINR